MKVSVFLIVSKFHKETKNSNALNTCWLCSERAAQLYFFSAWVQTEFEAILADVYRRCKGNACVGYDVKQ